MVFLLWHGSLVLVVLFDDFLDVLFIIFISRLFTVGISRGSILSQFLGLLGEVTRVHVRVLLLQLPEAQVRISIPVALGEHELSFLLGIPSDRTYTELPCLVGLAHGVGEEFAVLEHCLLVPLQWSRYVDDPLAGDLILHEKVPHGGGPGLPLHLLDVGLQKEHKLIKMYWNCARKATYTEVLPLVLPGQVQVVVDFPLAALPGEVVHLGHGVDHQLAESGGDDVELSTKADDGFSLCEPEGKKFVKN